MKRARNISATTSMTGEKQDRTDQPSPYFIHFDSDYSIVQLFMTTGSAKPLNAFGILILGRDLCPGR